MEILSDTTFRGRATFTSGFNVTGTSPVSFSPAVRTDIWCLHVENNTIYVNGGQLSVPYGTKTMLTNNNLLYYVGGGSFENPTIPSGCKKFAINQDTAKNIVRSMRFVQGEPYITQIRKVSTNELMDITISKISSNIGNSEFIFERPSTDEIPESYFRTTFIQIINS